jgi:hypothetical protein
MSYICCTPGCGNVLNPQGPINMMVSHNQGSFILDLDLDDNAMLLEQSLTAIKDAMPPDYDEQTIQLKTDEHISGSLNEFTVHDFQINLSEKSSRAKPEGTLTICCKKCRNCCHYDY